MHPPRPGLVAGARAQVTAAETEYRRALTAALTAGWSTAALQDTGYTGSSRWRVIGAS